MAPPAKRRKRNVLPSSLSDDDDVPIANPNAQLSDLISSSPTSSSNPQPQVFTKPSIELKKSSLKVGPHMKTANHPHNAAPIHLPKQPSGSRGMSKSAGSSPEKSKKKGRSEDKVKSGDIFTFFTKQAQRQQLEPGGDKTTTVKPMLMSQVSKDIDIEYGDLISDDDVLESNAIPSSFVGQAAKKRARETDAFRGGDGSALTCSQKFLKSKKVVEAKSEDDMRTWAERFAPANLEELAVHKRKVAGVRTWLEDVMNGRLRQRLLVLKGAAGTGKTTTVQLLAQAMDCDVLEWRNPVGSVATSDGILSIAAQFEEFMNRGGKFGQLDIFSENDQVASHPEPKPLDRRKQIILVEEFPNTFTRSSVALQSFRSTLIQYLVSNMPPLSMSFNMKKNESITPVVMIISETLLTTTSASADSFTAHRLLGPEILQHPGVGIIEFNIIAPTFLAKGLELILQKESRKSGRRRIPGPQVIKKLGEIGDIRSAIGSLEFMCLRGDLDGDWGAKVTFGKTKKALKNAVLTKMEEESLELITRREASLGIFHAVGKVVYNKREEPSNQGVEILPEFMSLNSRPMKSGVLVDQLIDEIGTDTQTFIAALHENYLPSCDASSTSFDISTLDHVNGCIDALSDSDLLCPSWDGSFSSTGFGGGSGGHGMSGDILRQDELSFQIAVRGLLFSLPYPVKRKAPASGDFRIGKGDDTFKMFYPTSLKLWRIREEIEGAVDQWVKRLMKGEDEQLHTVTTDAAAFARPKLGTVESWRNARRETGPAPRKGMSDDALPLVGIGCSARNEMLLERLPYMATIFKSRKNPVSALAIRDMEKVTSFHGINGSSEETEDNDDNDVVGEEWATDKSTEVKSPKKRAFVIRGRGMDFGLPLQQPEQKLVLSDDDIEDD